MDETLVRAVTDRVLDLLEEHPKRALLLGRVPERDLGWAYVKEAPYAAVMIGSLELGELLYFRQEAALAALASGMPVYLYEKGLPQSRSRPLAARLSAARRELKALGVVFVDGGEKAGFVSAAEARRLKALGQAPPAGAVLSPLARDILEEKTVEP